MKRSAAHPIHRQLSAMRDLIHRGGPVLRAADETISGWAVDQHLDHLLKVNQAIFGFLEKGKALDGQGINLIGRVALTAGFIPRGRAQAPAPTIGVSQSASALISSLEKIEEQSIRLLGGAGSRNGPKIFRHPVFGALTPRESIRFCVVHNKHHLRIIAEILKSRSRTTGG